jgi:hypothetical protein
MDTTLPPQALRALTHTLATARDEQIMRVVAMVDGLERRGAADGLIAALRPRLAELHPSRPLRFARLLFLPLDPLIVPAARWRAGSATVPRTALAPLAEAVHAALGADAATIDAAIAGHSLSDKDSVAVTGETLWPRAGAILATAPDLPGWQATGLPAASARGLARGVGAVLLAVVALRGLVAQAEIGVTLEPEPVQAILAKVATAGNEALAMAVGVLLAWLPEAAALLPRGASVLGPDGTTLMRLAAGQATEVLLDRLEVKGGAEAVLITGSLSETGAEVRRITTLLEALDEAGPAARRRRLAAIRGRLERSCRSRFANGLAAGVAAPLQAAGWRPTAEALAGVEATARGLRQLEGLARRLGGGAFYDTLLRDTAAAVWARPADGTLGVAEKVRLVEILAGSDEADALLAKSGLE